MFRRYRPWGLEATRPRPSTVFFSLGNKMNRCTHYPTTEKEYPTQATTEYPTTTDFPKQKKCLMGRPKLIALKSAQTFIDDRLLKTYSTPKRKTFCRWGVQKDQNASRHISRFFDRGIASRIFPINSVMISFIGSFLFRRNQKYLKYGYLV